MVLIRHSDSGILVKARPLSSSDIVIDVVDHRKITSEGTTEVTTSQDREVTRYTGATYDVGAELNASLTTGSGSETIQFESLDPGIATVTADGIVSRVSDGTARIKVSTTKRARIVSINVSTSSEVTDIPTGNWAADSLPKAIDDTINGLISGKTPSDATKGLWSGSVRNSSLWCASHVKMLTAVAKSGPIVIAPGDIMLRATHSPRGLNWISENGNQVSNVSVVGSTSIGNDITVSLLSRKLTYAADGIEPALAPPSDWTEYMPSVSSDLTLPAVAFDGDADDLLEVWVGGLSAIGSTLIYRHPSVTEQDSWWEQPIGGDSGRGIGFLIPISGTVRFVALGTWWFRYNGDNGGGHGNISAFISQANAAIATLRGGDDSEPMTQADLSEYPTY